MKKPVFALVLLSLFSLFIHPFTSYAQSDTIFTPGPGLHDGIDNGSINTEEYVHEPRFIDAPPPAPSPDPGSCIYFMEDFSGLSANTWSSANGDWYFQSEKLNIEQITTGKMAHAETIFYPDDLFTLDVDVERVSLPQGGAYGIYPFTTGDVFFGIDGKTLDGIGAIIFDSGNAYLTGWDILGSTWYKSDKYPTTSPVTSIGVAYSADTITLRINRQNTSLKFSGDFTYSFWTIDKLWLMAQGDGTHMRFDNVCSDPVTTSPPATYTLSVSKSGTGSGTVTSSPSGINCGSGCSMDYAEGTTVTLTAATGTGSTFSGWSGGGCSGTGTCVITMNADTSVTSAFSKTTTPIQAPKNLRYTLNGSLITINWDSASGASGYKINLGMQSGNYGNVFAFGNITQIGPLDISGYPAGTYYLAAKAFNGSQESGYSNEIAITYSPIPAGLQAPQNLRYTLNGNVITINWDAVSGASGYKISLGMQPGNYGSVFALGNITQVGPMDISSYAPGTYYVGVKAYNSSQESGYSNELAIAYKIATTININTITTTAVSSNTYKEIADPVSGFIFIFPNGGSGTLSTAEIISASSTPASDGKGYFFDFDGNSTVQIKIPFDGNGNVPQLFMFGNTEGCLDGGPERDQRWGAVPPANASGSNFLVFELGGNSSSGGSSSLAKASIKASGSQGFEKKAIWVNYQPASKGTQAQLQLIADIEWVISQLSEPLKTNAQNQYNNGLSFNIYNITATVDGGNAYSYGSFLQTPSFEFDNSAGADTYAHEGGHYINHLLMRAQYGDAGGDSRWWTIQDLAPEAGHTTGLRSSLGRQTVTEEYAYFVEHLIMGYLDARSDILWLSTYIKGFHGSDKPSDVDFPAIEGFGVTLLSSLLNTANTMKDWSGATADIPVMGKTVPDVFNVISRGASNIETLKNEIISALGIDEKNLAVVSERLGWSYHGKGKVISEADKTPLNGAKVQAFIKINSVEYIASETATDANGDYELQRLFPSCSTIRITSGGAETEFDFCDSDWSKETTGNLNLGTTEVESPLTVSKKFGYAASFKKGNGLPDPDWDLTTAGTVQGPPDFEMIEDTGSESWPTYLIKGKRGAVPVIMDGTIAMVPSPTSGTFKNSSGWCDWSYSDPLLGVYDGQSDTLISGNAFHFVCDTYNCGRYACVTYMLVTTCFDDKGNPKEMGSESFRQLAGCVGFDIEGYD
jgi:hypothetical protein